MNTIKDTFYLVITHVTTICCYLIIGLVIPVLMKIEIPILFLFTWILAPLITTMIVSWLMKSWESNNVRLYVVSSFALNLIYIVIYTWIESKQPHTEGDFMDFRGLVILVLGIGQVVGIIFSSLYKRKQYRKLGR